MMVIEKQEENIIGDRIEQLRNFNYVRVILQNNRAEEAEINQQIERGTKLLH